jgi:hypothetical protein
MDAIREALADDSVPERAARYLSQVHCSRVASVFAFESAFTRVRSSPSSRFGRKSNVVSIFRAAPVPKAVRERCCARCRDGHRCRMRAVCDELGRPLHGGRCRLHGGLSTGPRTAAGKAAIAESNRRRAVSDDAQRLAKSATREVYETL